MNMTQLVRGHVCEIWIGRFDPEEGAIACGDRAYFAVDTNEGTMWVCGKHLGSIVDVATLRTYDKRKLMTIAAGGGPRNRAEDEIVYCKFCNCRKNGWADEPNHVDESCVDPSCPCHNEPEAA